MVPPKSHDVSISYAGCVPNLQTSGRQKSFASPNTATIWGDQGATTVFADDTDQQSSSVECRLSSLLVITRSGGDADAVVVAMLRYELEPAGRENKEELGRGTGGGRWNAPTLYAATTLVLSTLAPPAMAILSK